MVNEKNSAPKNITNINGNKFCYTDLYFDKLRFRITLKGGRK